MATKKAKERTRQALVRTGREAAKIEAERDALAAELAEEKSAASDLRMKIQLREARVQHVEKTAADSLVEKNRRIEELVEELEAAEQERDSWEKRCEEVCCEVARRGEALSNALAEVKRRDEIAKRADAALAESKKLRRRVAELKAALAEATGRFHRACTALNKYEPDVVKKLFNEGRRSLREIEGRAAE